MNKAEKMVELFRVEVPSAQYFHGDAPVLYAGQQIHARVVLQLSEPMKARAINLHIGGMAQCHWTESERRTRRDMDGKEETYYETIHYNSKAIYIDSRMNVHSPPEQKIPAGQHIFPFIFTIPPHSAPSFEGEWGNIRYYWSATIDRPWKFNKKAKNHFVVAPHVDLNSSDWARAPIEQRMQKNIGVILFRHGTITANVRIPSSGFVPGERVPISIEIDNGTSKEVRKVKAKLHANCTYVAERSGTLSYDLSQTAAWKTGRFYEKRKKSNVDARMEELFALAANGKGTFNGELVVPASCVPSFNSCPLIQLEHVLEVKVETSGTLNSSVSMEVPVLIGTVPRRHQQQPPASNGLYPTLHPEPSAPPLETEPSAPPLYLGPPPPYYEESEYEKKGHAEEQSIPLD